MSNSSLDPPKPVRHAHTANRSLTLIIGVIGGVALFVGILYWYVHVVVNGPVPPLPNMPAASGSGNKTAAIVLDTPVLEIEPLSEMHVKIINGVAESIEPSPDADIAVKLSGQEITVTAAKDAKEANHQIKIHGAKGQETVLQVTVKSKHK